jgi:hypothetical protein
MNKIFESKQARLSWIWITVMMFITSIHHIFRLGYGLVPITILLTILPYALMRWYASTKNTAIMKTYSLYSALMFTWFGFIDGFMDHVLKAVGLQNTTFLPGSEAEVVKTALSLWSPAAGNVFYEGTGILTFITGVVAMVYLIRMIQVKHDSDRAGSLSSATV